MAGQVASKLCTTVGDNDIYNVTQAGEQRVTIRLSSQNFEPTEVKVYHVKQGRTKTDSDLVASYEDISTETREIKDLWLQHTDNLVVNVNQSNRIVVNVNQQRTTEQ